MGWLEGEKIEVAADLLCSKVVGARRLPHSTPPKGPWPLFLIKVRALVSRSSVNQELLPVVPGAVRGRAVYGSLPDIWPIYLPTYMFVANTCSLTCFIQFY